MKKTFKYFLVVVTPILFVLSCSTNNASKKVWLSATCDSILRKTDYSKNRNLDSIRNLLLNGSADTNFIANISKLNNSVEHYPMFLKEAEAAAQQNQTLKVAVDFLLIKGNYYQNSNVQDSALLFYRNAETKAGSNKNLLVKVYNSFGSFFRNRNEFDSAEFYFDKTISLSNTLINKKALGFALSSLVAVYERTGKIEKAKSMALRSLDVCRENGQWDRYLFAYLNLINVFQSEHKFDTALATSKMLLSVDSLFKDGKQQQHKSNLLMMCANTYRRKGMFDSALIYFDKVIVLAENSFEVKKIAEAYMLKGDIFTVLSDYPSSLKMYNKAVEYAEKGNRLDVMAFANIGIGKLYERDNAPEKAIAFTEKGIITAQKAKKWEVVRTGMANLMEYYMNSGNGKKARYYFDEIGKTPEIQESDLTKPLLLLANVCIREKKYEEGHGVVAKAFAILDKYPDAELWSYAHLAQAQLYLDEKKVALAEKIASEAFNSPKLSKTPAVLEEMSLILNKIYLEKKDFQNAYRYYTVYIGHKEVMKNEEKTRQFANIEFKAMEKNMQKEMDARERQFKMANQIHLLEIEKQKNFRNTFIAFLIVVSVLSIFIFRGFFNIRRSKRIIEQQKLLVDEKQKEILDSINYAKRIQQSLIPSEKVFAIKLGRHTDNEKP